MLTQTHTIFTVERKEQLCNINHTALEMYRLCYVDVAFLKKMSCIKAITSFNLDVFLTLISNSVTSVTHVWNFLLIVSSNL